MLRRDYLSWFIKNLYGNGVPIIPNVASNVAASVETFTDYSLMYKLQD